MTSYSFTETESDDPEHVEREDQEAMTVEYARVQSYEDLEGNVREIHAKAIRVDVVCSCGYTRCGAIGTFGLPRPVFGAEIEPIPSQSLRDRRAVVIRGTL